MIDVSEFPKFTFYIKKVLKVSDRRRLGIKIPIIGKGRGKILVPRSIYFDLAISFLNWKNTS